MLLMKEFNSIQIQKTLFNDGDKFTTYLPWDHPNM